MTRRRIVYARYVGRRLHGDRHALRDWVAWCRAERLHREGGPAPLEVVELNLPKPEMEAFEHWLARATAERRAERN